MSNINAIASNAIQSYAPQYTPLIQKEDKTSDKTNGSISSGGNTTVTLSSAASQSPNQLDYTALATQQTVKDSESVENQNTQSNQTTQPALTNSSNLLLQSNYNTVQNQTENLTQG